MCMCRGSSHAVSLTRNPQYLAPEQAWYSFLDSFSRWDEKLRQPCPARSPQVTTPNEDRHFAVTAKINRRCAALDLSRQVSSVTGTTISRQIVYRLLGKIGLYVCRPVRCLPLTGTHCHLQLTWSREHALWTPQQRACVMFSD
ncbi:transposable element Tcb1 transposase [Trichonephila clavipes]|nr:transposable element Tcb1 transposase [Trichonephila clavipes]